MAEQADQDLIPTQHYQTLIKSEQEHLQSKDKILFTLKYFLAGGVGGIFYVVSVYPLDTIKVSVYHFVCVILKGLNSDLSISIYLDRDCVLAYFCL